MGLNSFHFRSNLYQPIGEFLYSIHSVSKSSCALAICLDWKTKIKSGTEKLWIRVTPSQALQYLMAGQVTCTILSPSRSVVRFFWILVRKGYRCATVVDCLSTWQRMPPLLGALLVRSEQTVWISFWVFQVLHSLFALKYISQNKNKIWQYCLKIFTLFNSIHSMLVGKMGPTKFSFLKVLYMLILVQYRWHVYCIIDAASATRVGNVLVLFHENSINFCPFKIKVSSMQR